MSILSKDSNISNNQSLSNQKIDTPSESISLPKPVTVKTPGRKKMINDIEAYKDNLSNVSNFKRGSAFNMTNLYLKLSNLNFTIANIRNLSDEELCAIWSDIKSNK